MRQLDPARLESLPAARTEDPSLSGVGATAQSPEIRTAQMPALSRERKMVARDFDDAMDAAGTANTSLAEGHYGVTESLVRRLRTGEKVLGLAHLTLGPADVFRRVLVRAAVRQLGQNGATRFFAECIGEVGR